MSELKIYIIAYSISLVLLILILFHKPHHIEEERKFKDECKKQTRKEVIDEVLEVLENYENKHGWDSSGIIRKAIDEIKRRFLDE